MYGAVRVLSVFHISRYALGHVVLDVVVKECVVAVVEACRAEELGQCDGVGFGVCHDYAAPEDTKPEEKADDTTNE